MTPKQEISLTEKAVAAMRAAVKNVVEDHRKRGRPLVVWRNGQVVREMPVPANAVKETPAIYDTRANDKAEP